MRTPPPLMYAVFGSFSHGAVVAPTPGGAHATTAPDTPTLPDTPAESEFNNVLWKLNPPSPRTQPGLTPQTRTCAVPSKSSTQGRLLWMI